MWLRDLDFADDMAFLLRTHQQMQAITNSVAATNIKVRMFNVKLKTALLELGELQLSLKSKGIRKRLSKQDNVLWFNVISNSLLCEGTSELLTEERIRKRR
ncbi:unnamed protein product [Schistosoma margrebowiei]|uniref:Uncharacterized protein n=1 Tax=Schistosoma margrebowiei TaxID=48269 RepID=A0A183NB94_9TREM|nr:unnamed protein product [Schistosoma margrebowiei]